MNRHDTEQSECNCVRDTQRKCRTREMISWCNEYDTLCFFVDVYQEFLNQFLRRCLRSSEQCAGLLILEWIVRVRHAVHQHVVASLALAELDQPKLRVAAL